MSCGVRIWPRVVLLRLLMRCGAYLYKNTRLVFTFHVYTNLGVYLICSVVDESTILEVKKFLPNEGRWVSDDYNLYFWLKDYTVVSQVNPVLSLRDRLIGFEEATKEVNMIFEP